MNYTWDSIFKELKTYQKLLEEAIEKRDWPKICMIHGCISAFSKNLMEVASKAEAQYREISKSE